MAKTVIALDETENDPILEGLKKLLAGLEGMEDDEPPGDEEDDLRWMWEDEDDDEHPAEDDAGWQENKHPRVKGGENAGQFASGAQGGEGSAGGKEKTPVWRPSLDKDEHASRTRNVLHAATKKGNNYRHGIAKLITEGATFGSPDMIQKMLVGKLIESWGKSYDDAAAKGDDAKVLKILKTLTRLGWEAGTPMTQEAFVRPPTPPPPETHDKKVRRIADDTAHKMGFDPAKIHISKDSPTFVLNGKKMNYAGAADIRSPHEMAKLSQQTGFKTQPSLAGMPGEITLFQNHLSGEHDMAGVTAHEIEHQKFQTVVDAAARELNALSKLPDPPGPPGTTKFERSASGGWVIRKEYVKQFPIAAAVQEVLHNVSIETFEMGDGVSAYSLEYWQGFKRGNIGRMSAMHETLAEMARLKLDTGELPRHIGESVTSYRGSVKPTQESMRKGQVAWRKLFDTIDKLYPKASKS